MIAAGINRDETIKDILSHLRIKQSQSVTRKPRKGQSCVRSEPNKVCKCELLIEQTA